MCGVIGVVSNSAANQLLYDGLMVLQHRGQDAAGIVTAEESRFHMHKGQGLARDVFRTRDMRNLLGDMGVAHVRYPTAGSASSSAESQPFYVNSPYGIVLGHNGNLTNTDELKESLFRADLRHVNTNSDSEVLLNVLAHELQVRASGRQLNLDTIFGAVAGVHARCKGAYAVTAFIAGYGLLAFRDPHGIRPLVIGVNEQVAPHEYIVASESVAIDTLGFRLLRDVAPGEAVFVDYQRQLHSRQCSDRAVLNPCIFEYVYLARPDSVMDGVSVYNTRLAMGISLAEKIKRDFAHLNIDVVIPIPDTSRPSALQLANHLNVPYREGFIKNRYIGRTATSAAPSSCRGRRCARNRCGRSSMRLAKNSRAATCCWSTTPSCAAPPAARSCRWRAMPALRRCTSPRLRRRCVIRTSTASTCRPATN